MHVEYTSRSFKSGKHVLCEKPMAANVAEREEMIAAKERVKRKLMIAYRLRYEPFNQKAIELCTHEEDGGNKLINASHSQNIEAPNIRLSTAMVGGPGDGGIYCLNCARYLMQREPVEVYGYAHRLMDDPRFCEVPKSVTFTLKFPGAAEAHSSFSFGTAESRFYRVEAARSVIQLDYVFSYFVRELRLHNNKPSFRFESKPVDHFAPEMDRLTECILKDKAPRSRARKASPICASWPRSKIQSVPA